MMPATKRDLVKCTTVAVVAVVGIAGSVAAMPITVPSMLALGLVGLAVAQRKRARQD